MSDDSYTGDDSHPEFTLVPDGATAFRQNDAGTEPHVEDQDEHAVNEIATWIGNSLRVAWGCEVTQNIGIPGAIRVKRRGDDRTYFVGVEVDAE